MAQKDKVKELVGRGLNSYHTKSLQQIDRIEKKNKEQNHKISILSNELDNDYLTKTEEGSVISLEHSKEGMVYLDELQGNTLVNYCTDGSKEMTLNGDIDVEGTFVTTTEGVDNGLVDVMCEGNTLVNLLQGEGSFNNIKDYLIHSATNVTCLNNELKFTIAKSTGVDGKVKINKKENTHYTIVYTTKSSNTDTKSFIRVLTGNRNIIATSSGVNNTQYSTYKFLLTPTMLSNYTEFYLYYRGETSSSGDLYFKNVMVLEGDWTDKEIPPYFEGMKSVGQDDVNGHKIEILSTDLKVDLNTVKEGISISYNGEPRPNGAEFEMVGRASINNIYVKENTKITIEGVKPLRIHFYDINKIWLSQQNENVQSFTIPSNCRYIGFAWDSAKYNYNDLKVTSSNLNKKEILMNEPLRRLPNEVKDRIAKIGNKWYIERKLKQVTLNSSAIKGMYVGDINVDRVVLDINFFNNLSPTGWNAGLKPMALFETINWKPHSDNIDSHWTWFHSSQNTFHIICPKGTTLEQAIEKLDGCNVVYQIDAPIYEPLGVEPILNTYTDVTHISNSSVIPCNMKIKNSGYNAIIKPSTLYTVALDTNKTGTIGMNLGGAKGTTTNNILKLTTPATLTDDSLRLYGKDIKGSKVRLLEGDKTNWIPSHFEGMKSSFEDKLQEDGTYKMEILSNNKNLFNLDNFELGSYGEIKNGIITVKNPRQGLYDSAGVFKLKTPSCFKGKWITLSTNKTQGEGNIEIRQYDISNNQIWVHVSSTSSFKVLDSCEYISLNFNSRTTGTTTSWENIQIEISNSKTSYIEPKSNKIQFSSIEPLRGVGDVKDRFVFKDGKLIIERNCGEVTLNGSEDEHWTYHALESSNKYSYRTNCFSSKSKPQTSVKCNNFVSGNPSSAWTHRYNNIAILNTNNCHIYCDIKTLDRFKQWLQQNPTNVVYQLAEPIYEEIPFELQKIILEGYENGTLFIDTNIPPTSTVTYAGETPIVKSVKLNKTEVLNNTDDINDNIIPYLMDMDYRVVMLQLATEEIEGGVSMARLFGGTYEMIKRDILSKRLTREEYGYRLTDYFNAGKLTEEQVRELEDLR